MESENENKEKEENKLNINDQIKDEVEEKIEKILETGIKTDNVDLLYKLVDIHKDIENEKYWNKKKEVYNMNYRNYDEYPDGYTIYDRRGMPGMGRRYGEGNYGRRGVPGTGRRYRGEDMLDQMHEMYNDYSDNKEEYGRGNYGAEEDTMKSLDYMLKSVVQFIKMLKEDASSEEEMQLIKKYSRKISEM